MEAVDPVATEPRSKWKAYVNEEMMPETHLANKAGWVTFYLAATVAICLVLMLLGFIFGILAGSGAVALFGLKMLLVGIFVGVLTLAAAGITHVLSEEEV